MTSRKLTQEHYSLPVHTIRVTIHNSGKFFESDTRSGNHASIFLLTPEAKSVRLNMTKAGPTDTMGTYKQERHNYELSDSSLISFDLQTVPGVTVYHVISLIREKGRHNYRLAPSGVGCRHWVKTVVNDCSEKGYIASSSPLSVDTFNNNLRYGYSLGKEPEFDEIVPGTFV